MVNSFYIVSIQSNKDLWHIEIEDPITAANNVIQYTLR
jgi:hypothetical protein